VGAVAVTELYADVLGQHRAVAQLQAAARTPVHAYLLVGPPGTGKRAAARAFAAQLLCAATGGDDCEVCRRVLDGAHPDVVMLERSGASLLVDDAREIARRASTSSVEGGRTVLVLTDFHLVDQAAPALLKTIEEPPPGTVFVILAEQVPPELVTIASRCVRIDFNPLAPATVAEILVSEGVAAPTAEQVAAASGGRLDRARLLAGDAGFAARQAAWREVPARLDGTGAAVVTVADDLRAAIETVLEPVREAQAEELAELEERARQYGDRGPGREVEARHRREERRARTDELRAGLATLAGHYRDRLASGVTGEEAGRCLAAVAAIDAANEALVRNPNEVLWLQALLMRLSP
jgi:DNA polymerase-3 subunit delta'